MIRSSICVFLFYSAVVNHKIAVGDPTQSEEDIISDEHYDIQRLEHQFKWPIIIDTKWLSFNEYYMFQGNKKKLITAPRGFGKSTLMKSISQKIGSDLNHPVLFINLFASECIQTNQRAFEILREKIHLTYLKHDYLLTSNELDSRDKEVCERWCSMRFTEMTNYSMTVAFMHLSSYLWQHWGSNHSVVLMIDDYDSIIMNSLHHATTAEFKLVLQLMYEQISKLVNHDVVGYVILTGESYLIGAELASSHDIEMCRFLGDHSLVNAVGLNETRIDQLFKELNINKGVKSKVRKWYGGYTSKYGWNGYNPASIYRVIQTGVFKSYWHQNGNEKSLLKYIKISFVKESIKSMLRYECAPISLVSRANVDDLLILKAFLENVPESETHQTEHDIFFTHLFDQGYFSFGKNNKCISIPNLEVELELTHTLTQHYIQTHKLNLYRLEESARSINEFYSHAMHGESCLELLLNRFFKSLKVLFSDYRLAHGVDIESKDDLEEIMFALANCASGFFTKSKLKMEYLNENGKPIEGYIDLYLHKDSFVILIGLLHAKTKSPNSKTPLLNILNILDNITHNDIYTPKTIDHYLFIGLSINNKGSISISGLLDSKNINETITVPIRKVKKPPVKRSGNFSRKRKAEEEIPSTTPKL